MDPKILREAFDRLTAIEESDDPFCIGATGDSEPAGYKAIEETEQVNEDLSADDIQDGLTELEEIQNEMFELRERLSSAIRAYVPRRYEYWRVYGLAQLAILSGSGEYASRDESINNLIDELKDEYNHRSSEMDDDVEESSQSPRLR